MRILIIEDNPADARLAKEYIFEGARTDQPLITIAQTLSEAVVHLQQNAYDILLTDLALPDAMGVEAYRTISELAPSLPVIILTGNDDEEAAAALVADGAQDYLNKSDLSERVMRRSILYAIERKALEEKLKDQNRALATAQEELIYAAKMEATGHLAAGVAHEVKNPLAVIQLGLDTLFALNRKNPEPTAAKCLNRMQSALERADNIIHELLDFSSDKSFQWEMADINETIERAIALIRPQLVKLQINVETDFATDLPEIRIDRRKIEQTIINLLINCEHALEQVEIKKIDISTSVSERTDQPGQWVSVYIADSGDGIPESDFGKIFDAFYTTKDPDKGTGLGMTVVQKIIQLHDGSISLNRSEKLQGLEVKILLPMVTGLV